MQWRSQTNDRILEEGDGIYLNALDNQVNLYSEMILLNYLPDNVPLDAKFTLESNSLRTSISSQAPSQAQTQTPIILWCKLRSTYIQRILLRGYICKALPVFWDGKEII